MQLIFRQIYLLQNIDSFNWQASFPFVKAAVQMKNLNKLLAAMGEL